MTGYFITSFVLTGVTILLALSVYQIIVNEKLPASSDEVPVLGIFFTAVLET